MPPFWAPMMMNSGGLGVCFMGDIAFLSNMRCAWALGIGHWALGIGHWALEEYLTFLRTAIGLYFALVLARWLAKRNFDRTFTYYGISIALSPITEFRSHFDMVSGGMVTIESRSIDFRF